MKLHNKQIKHTIKLYKIEKKLRKVTIKILKFQKHKQFASLNKIMKIFIRKK